MEHLEVREYVDQFILYLTRRYLRVSVTAVRMGRMHDLPLEVVAFDLLSSAHNSKNGPRLGRLRVPGRKTIETPHYLALTSRGAVPHLSQDMMRDNTNIGNVYAALEDCEWLGAVKRSCFGSKIRS